MYTTYTQKQCLPVSEISTYPGNYPQALPSCQFTSHQAPLLSKLVACQHHHSTADSNHFLTLVESQNTEEDVREVIYSPLHLMSVPTCQQHYNTSSFKHKDRSVSPDDGISFPVFLQNKDWTDRLAALLPWHSLKLPLISTWKIFAFHLSGSWSTHSLSLLSYFHICSPNSTLSVHNIQCNWKIHLRKS